MSTPTRSGLEISVLGPLEVREGLRPISLGERQRMLLAVLVVHAGEVVASERLIEDVWSGRPPDTAATALQVHVSRLRRAMTVPAPAAAPRIVTRSPGYLLELPEGTCDLARFEALVAAGSESLAAGRFEETTETLVRALTLWRGEPLGDLGHEPFAQPWVSRLTQLRRGAVSDRIDAELGLGRAAGVLGELKALTLEDPLDERVCAQLMTALHRSGRQAHALRAFQALRRALADELGIEPGSELRNLEEAVLRQDLDGGPTPAPVARGDRGEVGVAAPPHSQDFVGRQREMDSLRASLGRALAGDTEIVVVTGEPGVGKTRLIEEMTGMAVASGARVAWGRCLEGEGTAPYWPWVQVLRQYLRLATEEELAITLRPHGAELAPVLPELGVDIAEAPPTTNPDGARFRLFDHMVEALAEASGHAPSVIVLDDIQWADIGTLRLLEFMAQNLRNVPAMLVAIHREDDAMRRGPLASTLATLARVPVKRIAVSGLETADVARYVELATGVASPAMAKEVQRRTNGNSFFVRELVAFLATDGQLTEDGHTDSDAGIPAGVRDIVRHRCQALSQDARQLLTMASAVGTDVRTDVVERAFVGSDFVDAMDELLTAGLLSEDRTSTGRLKFSHDLVRESVYGDLSLLRRARLHGQLATVLDGLGDTLRPPPAAEVARHFELALAGGADPAVAVEHNVRAAEAATRSLGYEDAVAHYARAIANLGSADQLRRGELLLALGDARWRAGDAAGARETCLEAAEIGRQLSEPRLAARAILGFGGGLFRSWHTSVGEANERLVSLLEEALAGLGEADDALRVRLLGHLAEQVYFDKSSERRLGLSAEAVDVAERLDDPATLAAALCSRCLAAWGPDHLTERIALSGRILELGQRLGDHELLMFGQQYLALGSFEAGDVATANAALVVYGDRAEQLRQPLFRWKARVLQTLQALQSGRFDDAETLADEALAVGEQAGEPDALNVYAVQLGMVRMEQDRLAEVQPHLLAMAEQFPETPWWETALAFTDADSGNLDEARRRFAILAADDFAGLPRDFAWSGGMALLALVASSLDDRSSAAVLHRQLEPFSHMTAMVGGRASWGSVALYLGILATTTGDHRKAETWLRQAMEANRRMGAHAFVARTRYHHARLLLSTGGPEDRARGDLLLSESAANAERLGMAHLARLVREAPTSADAQT